MSARGAAAAVEVGEPVVFAGRYRIEGEIARGAMGAVFTAIDLTTGRRIALKRQLGTKASLVRMFEREYHTLVSLKHPRIIEVYDYGVADGAPYYTMELLDGKDLRDLAPLDFRVACSHLRDIASSLGLLHTRRLLHRDLSPRNARVTADGRCKLIDFGSLSSFGISELVIGTPPCVPPETLQRGALDQRADLYALGSIAYWVLTGRHAYSARDFASLPALWRGTPPRPSEIVAALGNPALSPIPPELDDLVMSLLTLNPLGRPASAAEVIDRLVLIGGLAHDADEHAAHSYMSGVGLVGREGERERLRKRLGEAIEGRGACVVIEAAPGLGSSSLLLELGIDAQIAGAMPIVIDASLHSGPYGVVNRLIETIIATAPDDARAAAVGLEAILLRFSSQLFAELGVAPDSTDFSATPSELRRRMQAALCTWLNNLAARRPMMLAIDETQLADDASSAVLGTLANTATDHALLLVVSFKPSETSALPTTVRALDHAGKRMPLRPLSRAQVLKLVHLWFGAVEDASRLSDWLYRLTGGNPRACTELVEHLVREQVIRYILGAWVLPRELSAHDVPTSVGQLVERRLQTLAPDALKFAESLSVHRGQVPLEHCLALADAEAIADPFATLETLVWDNVLVNAGKAYQFSHDNLREALVARMPTERRQQLHQRMGTLIEGSGLTDKSTRLAAGWHLLRGGDEVRGARLLAEVGLELTADADDLQAAVPALRAALAVYRKQGKPRHELLRLLSPLAMAGYFVDRRLADEFGDEALALFEQSLGLGLWQRLRPVLGSRLAFFVGFGSAAVRFLLVPALGGIAGLRKTISDFIACVTTLTGAAAAILDPARARSIARRLEPFTALGSGHAATLAYRFVTLLSILPEERVMEVIAGFRELVARLEDPRPIPDLPPPLRRALYGGALYALGSMEIFREGPGALECAEKLEQSGLKIDEMVANQLRTLHHALRGEAQLADHYRSRVEANAILGGNGWQVEVWVPTSTLLIYILTQDVIGVKRSSEQIDRLSQEIPSLRRKALEARGEYHHLKGEHELGFKFLQVFSPSIPPHSFLGWSNAAASHVRALNRLGRHAEAKALIEPIIAGLSEDDRSVFAFNGNLFRELAHAHAGLGDHAAATALIDELLQRHAPSQNPLLLGNLHATAVAIAAGAGETARALEHLAHMDKWFRPTGNPSLIGQCERLLRQLDRVGDDHGARPDIAAHESASEEGTRSVRSLLSQCLDGDQRAELSRRLLLTHMRAQSGYLFAYDEQGLRLIAPQHGQEPPNELVLRIVANIASDAEAEAATVITRAPGSSSMPPPMPNADIEQAYRVFLLSVPSRGCMQTVGAIAVAVDAHPLQAPDQAFLQNVAYSLFESGAASATETKQS